MRHSLFRTKHDAQNLPSYRRQQQNDTSIPPYTSCCLKKKSTIDKKAHRSEPSHQLLLVVMVFSEQPSTPLRSIASPLSAARLKIGGINAPPKYLVSLVILRSSVSRTHRHARCAPHSSRCRMVEIFSGSTQLAGRGHR